MYGANAEAKYTYVGEVAWADLGGGAIGAIAPPLKPTKVIFITHDFVQFGETAFTI